MRLKGIDGLRHDLNRVSNFTHYRKSSGFDARDIDQTSDEAVHPSTRPLNALSAPEHVFDVILPRHSCRDERRGADHCIQHIPQVVANEAEKLVPCREQIVGPSAFTEQVLVRFLAFARQKADVLSPFVTKGFVCVGSLLSEGLVFQQSFPLANLGRLRAGNRGRRLSIRLRASGRKHSIGTRPRPADDGVRSLIDGSQLFFESMIRLLAFESQTFVGLFAL